MSAQDETLASVQSEATTSSTSALSSTTQELFRIWLAGCLEVAPPDDSVSSMSGITSDRTATSITRASRLRQEASNFFRSLVRRTEIVTATGTVLTTKASHEEALALLIQQLGPAFTSNHPQQLLARTLALACIRGALEGCYQSTISIRLARLLGDFFLQHCGPIEQDQSFANNDQDQDYDEQLRDEAIQGLACLESCRIRVDEKTSLVDVIQFHTELAQNGVQRRCAEPQHDETEDAVALGLSVLPRSRRSLCFELVRSAVDAVGRILADKDFSAKLQRTDGTGEGDLERLLVQYASFATRCLHGESDPRCLMQLLELLHALLVAWLPFMKDKPSFPVGDVFDAVAPYYPIQFTPPPSDVHGITRKGLRSALLAVLCFCDYDAAVSRETNDTMMSLSLGIILERLVPPPEDGPATMTDRKEGLEDLDSLLLGDPKNGIASRIDEISSEQMRQVSDVLMVVHEESSVAVLAKSGFDQEFAKEIANSCRDLVAKLALETERISFKNQALWNSFVGDSLSRLASKMTVSSSQGRVAIAYAACLCSCGGPKTLRLALEVGLDTLLRHLDPPGVLHLDDDDLATTAYGVGAFFSSTRAALEKITKDGIVITPHPLENYSSRALDRMEQLLTRDENGCGSKVAAVSAFESILLVCPAQQFPTGQIEKITQTIQLLVKQVQLDSAENDLVEFRKACAVSVGHLLGQALDSTTAPMLDDSKATVLQSLAIKAFLTNQVLPDLVSAAEIQDKGERYELKVLALVSTSSLTSAGRVVQPLVNAANSAFLQRVFETGEFYSRALGRLFQEKGSFAPRAFQLLDAPNVTPFDLIASLVACVTDNAQETQEKGRATNATERALSVARLLQPAYSRKVISSHIDALVASACTCLPPRTDPDLIQSSVELCFLSAALRHKELQVSTESCERLVDLEKDLIDFALSCDYSGAARCFAADCLYSIALRYLPASGSCAIESIIVTRIMTKMYDLANTSRRKELDFLNPVEDCLSIIGLLGSAAAQIGTTSAKTADQVVNFLVDLACTRVSVDALDEKRFDLKLFDSPGSPGVSSSLSVHAASALGTMLTSESGARLWKQRLTHMAAKRIHQSFTTTTELSDGMIAAVGQLICGSDLRTIPAEQLDEFVQVMLRGLAPRPASTFLKDSATVSKLVLASVVKLMSAVPSTIKDQAYLIVTGSMRAYAAADKFESGDGIVCKVLALQTLEAATHIVGALHILKDVKAPVVSILGAAMNHPSSLLRQAAVEVRNAWLLVE